MSFSRLDGFRIAGVSTCVPTSRIDNLALADQYDSGDIRKVVSMAGVRYRHVVDEDLTAVDLCAQAAKRLLDRLGWRPETVTGLIMVTQSPDYFLPSSACLVHARLALSSDCAAFDIGLGCSGYPYGMYVAATMLKGGGQQRILMLHGETPSRFTSPDDHSTRLLFGDAGSATALETAPQGGEAATFGLFTDGTGADGLIIRGGAFRDRHPADPRDLYVRMDGAAIFNFTIKRVPAMINDSLEFAGLGVNEVDVYLFHQSNRFIIKHLTKKCGLPEDRVPLTIEDCGNCGGPSVAVTLTRTQADRKRPLRLMLLGYGVGLSWGSAIVTLDTDAALMYGTYEPEAR